MSRVDATGAQARVEHTGNRQTPRTDEPFEAVLACVQNSSNVNEAALQRARGLGESFQRHQRVMDEVSQAGESRVQRQDGPQQGSGAQRVERLRESKRSSGGGADVDAPKGDPRSQDVKDQPVDSSRPVSDAPVVDGRPIAPPDPPAQDPQRVSGQPADSAPASTPRPDVSAQTGSAARDVEAARPAPTAANQAPPETAAPNGQASSGSMMNTPKQSTGGQASLQQAAATATAKSAMNNARPAGTTDFQNVLQAAQRGKETSAREAGIKAVPARSTTTLNLKQPESMEELGRVIRSNLNQKNATLTMRLDPAELGTVRIDIRMQDHKLTLHIETETRAGHEALQSRLGDLRHVLEQHGISVQRADVDMKLSVAQPADPQDAAGQYSSQPGGSHANGQQGGTPSGEHGNASEGIWSSDERFPAEPLEAEANVSLAVEQQRPAESGVNVIV